MLQLASHREPRPSTGMYCHPASYLAASVSASASASALASLCGGTFLSFHLLPTPAFVAEFIYEVWPTHAMMLLVPRTPYLLPQRRPAGYSHPTV